MGDSGRTSEGAHGMSDSTNTLNDCSSAFTDDERLWLVANSAQIKSIINGRGRVNLDLKTTIELYSRRMKQYAIRDALNQEAK